MKKIVLPLLLGASVGACTVEQKQPNVLILLTDDQGWGDVGVHGNPLINTPTLDKLYRQSAVFNHFYACPLSATTRASLLTGRYHLRTWVSHVDRGLENMNPDETTIAEVFKEKGYQTGCFGKWHNGAYFPYTPNGQGFDEFVGFSDGLTLNYFDPLLQHNEVWGREKGFITDIFTDKAIQFIEKNKDQPFLCYVPYNAPHAPYQVPDEYYDRYAGLTAGNQRDRDVLASIYAMVENVDFNISRILDKLDELKLTENTIVLFMSDNGPTTVPRYNGNMRGQKSTVYEGGMRVPCYISWKGKITHKVIDEPASIVDIMPSLLSLCGYNYCQNQRQDAVCTPACENYRQEAVGTYQTAFPMDGVDLTDLIFGKTDRLRGERMIFSHVWGGRLAPFTGTVRTNDYRLSVFQDRTELYDIKADPGEKENLYEREAEKAKTLYEAYRKWFDDASQNVKLNPLVPIGYDEARTVRIQAPEGKMNGQLAYYSRIPNRSWVYPFLTPDDYLIFELDAVRAGDYEIAVEYAQPGEGSPMLVVECGSITVKAGLPYCIADSIPAPDRVVRWQAHERLWGKQSIGVVPLQKGQHVLKLYAENTTSSNIQINSILITRKESGKKEATGVDRKKIDALAKSTLAKDPSEHNTDWFGTMPLAGILSWHSLGYYPQAPDYITNWLNYHHESHKVISDEEFHARTSAGKCKVIRGYTLLLALYCGYPGANFVCGPLYKLTGNEMARQVCKDVGDLILNKIPRNDLGMLKHDDFDHDFTIPDAAYFYVPALFIAARAYDREVQAGDAAAKAIQDKLMALGSDQLKKFTDLFLDKEKKIAKTVYRHGKLGDTYWTRANGWLLWTIVESVEHLDKDSEIYAYACNALDVMAQGIARYQDPSGAFHLLVDEPDTPLETSGTIMTAYGIHKAVRLGWIDRKYLPLATKAWDYVDSMIDAEGNISGCYSGWAIPAEERDMKSFGPLKSVNGMLLTAGAEFEK